jgi:DNA-binding response OmpR family regulator
VAILTAREDENIKQQIIDLGAHDYFVKGKNIEELARLRDFIIANM